MFLTKDTLDEKLTFLRGSYFFMPDYGKSTLMSDSFVVLWVRKSYENKLTTDLEVKPCYFLSLILLFCSLINQIIPVFQLPRTSLEQPSSWCNHPSGGTTIPVVVQPSQLGNPASGGTTISVVQLS